MYPSLKAHLVGNLLLVDDSGRDCTPVGAKARALIALLALTPERRRPRRWIEGMLWSDRSPEQASSSLRQVLMELRAALGPAAEALQTDRQSVGLPSLATDIDADENAVRDGLAQGHEVLEGLRLRDPAFTAWLADQRARLAGKAPVAAAVMLAEAPSIPLMIRTQVVSSGYCGFVSMSLAESIGKLVSDYTVVDIFGAEGAMAQLGPKDRGLVLNVTASETDGKIRIIASLQASRTGQVLWSRQALVPVETPDVLFEGVLPPLIFEAAEAAMDAMPRLVGTDPGPLRAEAMISRAVHAIFTFEKHQLRLADDLLRDASALAPSSRAFAWRGVLRQFMAIERTETNRDTILDEAEMFSRRAMEAGSLNSLVLSLMSQVQIMLYDNVPAGEALARDAIRVNPQNAFGYVAQAGSLLRQGRPEEAYAVADFGAGLAARSSFLHWWEMHKGLAATQMGDFATAIACFEAARSRAPNFRAPLRHLIFLYLARGQPERAQRALADLKRLEPDFTLDRIREDPSYPAGTLRRARLLKISFPDQQ